VEGRKLRFKVECRDEKEIVGTGFHERAVIDPAGSWRGWRRRRQDERRRAPPDRG
jgi:predicted thioesterase